MAEAYRFFGGTADDPRQYNQIEFAEVLERFFQNGYFPSIGGELQVVETDPPRLAIRVASGQAWINGYWYKNDDWKEINLAPADATYARIDRVVLRLDIVNDRNILATVKTGTPSATPVAPDLERTEQYWELGLATVYVAAGVTSVTNANITDTRHQSYECGKAVPRNPEVENHLNDKNNPHNVTKAQVGLGNVDNIKQMPISGGTFTGIVTAHSNTSYTTRQIRNIILSTANPNVSAMQDGDIWIKYR